MLPKADSKTAAGDRAAARSLVGRGSSASEGKGLLDGLGTGALQGIGEGIGGEIEESIKARIKTSIKAWAFDLDNTLYPHHCDLFAQIDRRMGGFIAEKLALPANEARLLQKELLRDYATTLQGLASRYGIDAREFLSFVHDIDYGCVPVNPRLAGMLEHLAGCKVVFTNATKSHAERVLERLGVPCSCFDHFLDIAAMGYQPKPHRSCYEALLERCRVKDASEVVMLDDLPSNLKTAHEMGMVTVLVDTPSRFARLAGDERYVDFVVGDVESFLENFV